MQTNVPALENFRTNLKKACDALGITQEALANRSGVHAVTINKILRGRMEPTIPLAEKLAKALDSSLDKILRDPIDRD